MSTSNQTYTQIALAAMDAELAGVDHTHTWLEVATARALVQRLRKAEAEIDRLMADRTPDARDTQAFTDDPVYITARLDALDQFLDAASSREVTIWTHELRLLLRLSRR